MGVCTVERPVMHWQQSARFGPPRERSPTLPGPLSAGQCLSSNNNHIIHRPCDSCSEPCEHSGKHFGSSPIFSDSCRSFDQSDRSATVFDDSGLRYLESGRDLCTDIRSGGSSCLELKSEPLGPSSPESSSELLTGPEDCAGCGRLIQDRFYLSAVEKRWHAGCLQCCVCRQQLDGETSCFSRDGNIYCKSDYYRVFGTKRCSRCMASISSSELVMRARHLVFHIRCFSCAVCNTPLTKGDQFGMRESSVFCRSHYEISLDTVETTAVSLPMSCQYSQFGGSPNTTPSSPGAASLKGLSSNSGGGGGGGGVGSGSIGGGGNSNGPGIPAGMSGGGVGDGVPGGNGGNSLNFFNSTPPHNMSLGLQQAPRQKGRPRKRKPKEIDAMTSNLDLNSDYLDLGFGRGGAMSAASRAKRMRTSFKHHQLRTMKSYFAINHNPDAKDLKQLSQKTGLPKRVLQVWFQNARAKWRRMMMKQEGKGGTGSDKGDGSLDLDSYSHSPSYMLGAGPPSPNSID